MLDMYIEGSPSSEHDIAYYLYDAGDSLWYIKTEQGDWYKYEQNKSRFRTFKNWSLVDYLDTGKLENALLNLLKA